MPNRRVREFVGRESVLAQIDASFNSESEIGPRIVVLRAMGGQGKTQIALEYCRRTRNRTGTAVFWVDASSENSLKQSYSTISEILASQADILTDVNARVNFTLRKLRAWRTPWLIVLDNYDNPVDFNNVAEYIPDYEQGMVLVTSRHADADALPKEENQIQLPGLLESEAIELLLSQGKRHQMDHVASSQAKLIVERLDYHPLAIAQAGAYTNKRKLPLAEFLDHFQSRKAIILKDTTPQMSQYRRRLGGAEQETSLSVFTTWELSYQQLLAEDTDEKCMADFLTLLAFFAAGGVSEGLLKAYCDRPETAENSSSDSDSQSANSGGEDSDFEDSDYTLRDVVGNEHLRPGAFLALHEKTWNSDLYCDALATIAQLSLVEGFEKAPDGMYKATLHPLVRDWIRLRTEKTACVKYTYLAATCIHRLLRSGLINKYFTLGFSIGQDLLKHIAAHVMNMEDYFPQASDILDGRKTARLDQYDVGFGSLCRQFGEYSKAREIYSRCLARRKNNISTNDRFTRRLFAKLGGVMSSLGEHKEAKETLRNVLHMALEINGEEHKETLEYMIQLSAVLLGQDLNEEAEEYVRKSLGLGEKLYGKEDPLTLSCMSNLGIILASRHEYEEAENVFRRTLKLHEIVLGKEHPDTIAAMYNLTLVLTRPEDCEEKEDLYRQVLEIEERMLGKEHPRRMQAMTNFANLMVDMGRYDEAEEIYVESMKSLEFSLGQKHQWTLNCYQDYGRLLRMVGRYEEALQLLQRAYRGYCEIFGPQYSSSSYCATQLGNLGQDLANKIGNLVNAGQNEEAEEMYIRSMKSLDASLGKDNLHGLCFTSNYGIYLREAGRYVEALPLFEDVYTRTLDLFGSQHPDTLRREKRLDRLLEAIQENIENLVDADRNNEAEEMYIQLTKSLEASFGRSHRYTLRFTSNYGIFLRNTGRYMEALPLHEEVYTRTLESLGLEHANTLSGKE